MHLCYVDESGDAEALRSAIPDAAPVFVLVGVTVPQQAVDDLTWDFLKLKKELNPSLAKDNVRLSDLIQAEMKGSTLRADFRKDGRGRNVRRRAFRALDKIFELREQPNCQLVGKIVVKVPDDPNPPAERAVYSRAISEMAASFQAQLGAANTDGLMILDARTKVKNTPSVMGVTTQRFRKGGSAYPNLVESPLFGHSDTHVPLQIADIVASAVLFPIACSEYCGDLTWNTHPHERYKQVKERYGEKLQRLEYRYTDADGNRRGGFQVIDLVDRRPTHLLFRD